MIYTKFNYNMIKQLTESGIFNDADVETLYEFGMLNHPQYESLKTITGHVPMYDNNNFYPRNNGYYRQQGPMTLKQHKYQEKIASAQTDIMFKQVAEAIANNDIKFKSFFKMMAKAVNDFLQDEYMINTDDADELLNKAEAWVLDDFADYIIDPIYDMFPEADEDDLYEVIEKVHEDKNCIENISSNMWEYVNEELAQEAVNNYKKQMEEDKADAYYFNRQYQRDKI